MGLTNFPFGITSFGVPVLGGGEGRGLVAFRKVYFVDGDNGNDGNLGLSIFLVRHDLVPEDADSLDSHFYDIPHLDR